MSKLRRKIKKLFRKIKEALKQVAIAVFKFLKETDYRHYICVAITLGFIALAIFVFPNAFVRIIESCVDLGTSVAYYVQELFYAEWHVRPTVIDYSKISWTPIFGLPATWEEFEVFWGEYWRVWATKENLTSYIDFLSTLLYNVSRILLMVVVPAFLCLYLLFLRYLNKHNNDYNVTSKPLKFCKWIGKYIWLPIKRWVRSYVEFVKVHSIHYKLWIFIWAYNFNALTIILEFLAFYFYFVISFDVGNLYKQVYKLFCDLSVVVAFIPVWGWCIIGYLILCAVRKSIGYKTLNHYEHKNCGFINERPIVLMVCGTMGKKKTTAITDMALSQETMLRDKAYEKLMQNDLKFPYFPWINLENALKTAIYQHDVYNLATVRKYIRHLRYLFEFKTKDKAVQKSILRHLRKRYKVGYRNLIFGYAYKKYGLFHDDKLKVVNVWEVIETYAQLYFIYIIQSSLIISNYSVRTDGILSDLGNFPMWDNDYFKRNSKIIDDISRHAHIIDFNALRLGKNLGDGVDVKKDSFEFGVVNITEVGKERKNNLQLQETKKKDDTANQKNDGFNDWLKMIRHSATVDNFPFVKVITDEQRPESWGADARDLCEIVHIKETSDTHLAMPFFALTELFYDFVYSKFLNLYTRYRYMRGDNTLLMYVFKKLTAKLNNYYNGIYNTFGYCKLTVQVESGTQDGEISEKKYYLMSKKIYSKRFSTDCFSDFFSVKSLRSPIGIDDLQEYETEKATFEELQEQKSYFIEDLMRKQEKENADKSA